MKTNLVNSKWVGDIRAKLDVYGFSALNLPLIEKVNVDSLCVQIGADLNIQRVALNGLTANLSKFQEIAQSIEPSNLWVLENIGSLYQSLESTNQHVLEEAIIDLAIAIKDRSILVLAIDYGDNRFPEHLRSLVPLHELPLPTKESITSILGEFQIESERLVTICAGLGCEEIRIGLKLALKGCNLIALNGDEIEDSLLKYKIAKLRELGLEFLGDPDISAFGGLDRIKAGMIEVVRDFSPAAQKMGIARPKGWLFVGPPGTGKTHTAKCIATELKWPLISVGIDAIKSGGADLLKILLQRIEAAAPCVVYFDELDKFFSSATDAQILGVLLTWLQEKTSETFVLATLNRLEKLPPELTRAGRFDRLFWIGFANELERYEIIRLYAKRYDATFKTVYGRLDREEWLNILNMTDKFTGAELKSLVDRAARLNFYQRENWLKLLHETSEFTEENLGILRAGAVALNYDFLAESLCEIADLQGTELSSMLAEIDYRVKQASLEVIYKNLMLARKDTVSLYERNPAGILDIENQAKRFSEPGSSLNDTEDSLFRVEAISLYGD